MKPPSAGSGETEAAARRVSRDARALKPAASLAAFSCGATDVLNTTVTFTGNSTFVGDIALGTAYTIVGVMPRGFHFPDDRIELWTPAASTRPRDARQRTSMFAQLREGVSIQAATADFAAIIASVRGRTASPFAATRFELVRLEAEVIGDLRGGGARRLVRSRPSVDDSRSFNRASR